MWGCVWRYVCPCVFSWQWNATTDIDRSQGNVQLQVVASCCHWAHLSQGKASWEAGGGRSEGRHSSHRWWSNRGSCQAGCWPCLAPVVLWNSSPLQFQSNNITALILLQTAVWGRGIFPLEYTTALWLYLSIFWLQCRVDCTESLLRLIWQLGWLFWLDDETFLVTNAAHRCSVSDMSQYKALQEHNWSDLLSVSPCKSAIPTLHCNNLSCVT